MLRIYGVICALLLTGVCLAMENPVVEMKTSEGTVKIELYADKAPITVKNFLQYVNNGFYDGTIFHRVIDGFMIQGGGFTADMKQKEPEAPIKNEAGNGLHNGVGTLAMARTSVVDSATSQFFINVADNASLDHRGDTSSEFGYCVFGQVIDSLNVVKEIQEVPTTTKAGHQDVPTKDVEIISMKEIKTTTDK